MGKPQKLFDAFVDDIPDSKLKGLPTTKGTIHKDRDFRLDMQGMTSDKPAKHNLQIQINNETTEGSLKPYKKATVSTVLAPSDPKEVWSPAKIKTEFKTNFKWPPKPRNALADEAEDDETEIAAETIEQNDPENSSTVNAEGGEAVEVGQNSAWVADENNA